MAFVCLTIDLQAPTISSGQQPHETDQSSILHLEAIAIGHKV